MAGRQENKEFKEEKKIQKTRFTLSINENGRRFLKVRVATQTQNIISGPDDILLVKNLVDSAEELRDHGDSDLNPEYVKSLLQKKDYYVIVYNRNEVKLANEGKGISGFMIYDMELENNIIDCNIHCLLSVDSRDKIDNLLTKEFDKKPEHVQGCGTVALKDLEDFMQFMLRHLGREKARGGRIKLNAIPSPKVVGFYKRRQFEIRGSCSDPNLVPMERSFTLVGTNSLPAGAVGNDNANDKRDRCTNCLEIEDACKDLQPVDQFPHYNMRIMTNDDLDNIFKVDSARETDKKTENGRSIFAVVLRRNYDGRRKEWEFPASADNECKYLCNTDE